MDVDRLLAKTISIRDCRASALMQENTIMKTGLSSIDGFASRRVRHWNLVGMAMAV